MISKPLFIQTIKSNIKLFLIITAVLCGLISIVMTVFTPSTMESINSSSQNLPFNPLGDISSLINFISNQYFGMFALIFSMIYLIIVGNRLIVGQVDKGNMTYYLSTPITRTQVTSTYALFMVGSLTLMFALVAGVGMAVAAIMQPDVLDNAAFLRLTFGEYLLQLAISGIVFCASCIFNRASRSLSFGAGLPILFFATNLLAGMSKDLDFLKYLSLITLFDTDSIISGEGYAIKLIVLAGIAVVLYILGMKVFKEKDLPL
jgi:ABC-2 type transport system permease protein